MRLAESETIDFSALKMPLFPYQQQGAGFAVFKSGCIIADEMGLGKTAQAIAVAINKKRIFDFKRTLIVCPATLKQQWQKEIARFCHEKAEIIQGPRPERLQQYMESDAYFLITNYESLLRDIIELKRYPLDFMILDKAQRIQQILAEGLVLKESLFDAVLNQNDLNDEVDFSRRGRATFIQELQTLVSGLEAMGLEETEQLAQDSEAALPESSAEVHVDGEEAEKLPPEPAATFDQAVLQQTLDQGLQFLNGIFKMATGSSLLTEEQTINVDANTGEVTIKFKLPKIGKPV